jgi:hypothetical protein
MRGMMRPIPGLNFGVAVEMFQIGTVAASLGNMVQSDSLKRERMLDSDSAEKLIMGSKV